MRAPTFPLNRSKTYSTVRGAVLFFHHGSWCLRYRRHGKKREESLGTKDDRLAWAELQKASQQFLEGATPQELITGRRHTTIAVAEAGKEFVTTYTTISLGTARKMRLVMSKWVIGEDLDPVTGAWVKRDDAAMARPLGALDVHLVEKADVRAHLKRVRSTVNQYGRRNSRATAKIVLDAIRLLFNWLIDEGKLKSKDGRVLANPAARAGQFTFDAEQDTKATISASGDVVTIEDVHVFEPEQEAALLGWFHTHCRRLYAMLLLGVGDGLRYGEVIALEIADYEPTRHRVRVTKHWTPDGVIVGTKSNRAAHGSIRTREVPTNLDPRVEPALAEHIRWLRATTPRGWDGKRLFPAAAYTRDDGTTNLGAYMTPSNFYRAVWNRACLELGIKDLTFHNLRHTFASKGLYAGATPQEVAAWLGDTLEVTLRHYAHVIKDAEARRSATRAGLLAPPPAAKRAPVLRVIRRG